MQGQQLLGYRGALSMEQHMGGDSKFQDRGEKDIKKNKKFHPPHPLATHKT